MPSAGRDRSAGGRPLLIDVSRLVWRMWTGRLPTGIDRVCLAYLDHYGKRAQAVVQGGGRRLILSDTRSEQLFSLLRARPAGFRRRLMWLLAAALPTASGARARAGALYLNVGHTGLDDPSLPAWVARNRLRAIYLVHDLIPLTHPEYCRAGEAAKHQRRMTAMLVSAHGIISNSQATLSELAAFASARGLALPPTVAAWISGPPPPTTRTPPPIGTPYFVMLGTIEGRKNHRLVLEIWREMVHAHGGAAPTLVVIGQRGWEAGAAIALLDDAPAFGGKLIERNCCNDGELAGWIGGARALLMPTFTEGFGLPIIEALQLQTPVIASDLPVFREIAGTIPVYLDPTDRDAWASTIAAFCGDDSARERQVEQMASFEAPTWDGHFAVVDQWLARL